MADSPRHPDTSDDTGVGPGREYPGTPRWVKVFGIIVIVLILLVVINLIHRRPHFARATRTIERVVQQPCP